ncbi:hypothetical protein DM01DRAFT_1333926 [Hesseltinella vesiculosa]|uniref:Uncharacterized protein n=1 Tax=Hesseltinella vesiculosa TaxID=101127 RepID=A0A1X2GPB8_9FUNG|nr:hypothetical protein DM01DRAFT_1333926 [Hesseltinella vesiculosa]
MSRFVGFFTKARQHLDELHEERAAQTSTTTSANGCENKQNPKFLADPTRTEAEPEVVGHFTDPMGARKRFSNTSDVTDTGA